MPVTRMPCGAAQRSTHNSTALASNADPRVLLDQRHQVVTGKRLAQLSAAPLEVTLGVLGPPLRQARGSQALQHRRAGRDGPNETAGRRPHSSAETFPAWPRPAAPGPRRPRQDRPGTPRPCHTVLRPEKSTAPRTRATACPLAVRPHAAARIPRHGLAARRSTRTAPATTGRRAHGARCRRATRPAAGSGTRRRTTTTGGSPSCSSCPSSAIPRLFQTAEPASTARTSPRPSGYEPRRAG